MKKQSERKAQPFSSTVFGDKIVELPGPGSDFVWGLYENSTKAPFFLVKRGDWVSRGEPICNYPIYKGGLLGGYKDNLIFSLVSGLVICTVWDSGGYGPFFAILPPAGEPIPESVEDAYSKFCELCSKYRRHVFGKFPPQNVTIDEVLSGLKNSRLILKPLQDFQTEYSRLSMPGLDGLEEQYPSLKNTHMPLGEQA